MLIVDSGVGGVSVVRALRAADGARPLTYLADTAWFPYGKRTAESLADRATQLIVALQHAHPSLVHAPVVLACNTLSTLALAALRARMPQTVFVGTVPAVKVAAAQSRTRRFTLLATPNTAHSPYTHELITQFASGCVVDVAPAPNLAQLAESMLLGMSVAPETLADAIRPAFHDDARGKTDGVVLGCTHYPLILPQLRAVSPWDVAWIDSSAAIARRAIALRPDAVPTPNIAYVTGAADVARYQVLFAAEGFTDTAALEPVGA